ncbi:MAG: hydantoinase/oxoprolinase family protein [Candidatus Rokuibacteriota bacterium]|nr:MAG: hydantoinase/oxoprolinase family protein [Candidatus Rokubacteria bacterium]
MAWRLGIDVGGTFTDLAMVDDASGRLVVAKVPSVPAEPARGIVDGIRLILAEAGARPADVRYLAHGTTVSTNALLERKGARTGLLTTGGFRDLLEIGRQRRPSLYDLHAAKPAPLVPGRLRREVTERVMADGAVRTPLDLASLEAALDVLAREGIEALGICFLYSYLRPEHEQRVLERARARLPGVFCSASHEVAPEFREYERLSTTVANAYLGPTVASYVQAFRGRARALGLEATPYINQSNGGTMSIDEAARTPVKTLLSGPSAGVAGAAWLAGLAGFPSVVTFDMGGTSTDVSLVRGGVPALGFEREIAGVPIRSPALDIHTIGAGGGSIAWRDSGGALLVGPESAGAEPGPACYGRGGTAATVTDANLVLGRLSPGGLLGGRMPLDLDGARRAVTALGQSLGLGLVETARGILAVVNANMARALRLVTVQRGVDPSSLALLPFGGAGPLHAAALARELGIRTILIPPGPGVLCALGLLVEDLRTDTVRTWVGTLDTAALGPLAQIFTGLEREAIRWLDREQVPASRRRLERWLDLRYTGQNYELLIPVDEAVWRQVTVVPLRRAFLRAHEETYGFAAEDEPIQVVNARLVARGVPDRPALPSLDPGEGDARAALVGHRPVDFGEGAGPLDCPIYDRARLGPGHRLAGPGVIEQFDSTTLVYPGQALEVDARGLLVITEG